MSNPMMPEYELRHLAADRHRATNRAQLLRGLRETQQHKPIRRRRI